MQTETIIYKGIKFARYPNSKSFTDRNYFRPTSKKYREKGIQRLHQEVYKDNFGDIPKDFVVHHKDHNPSNNSPENLETIHRKEHFKYHFSINYADTKFAKKRFISLGGKMHKGFDKWKNTDNAKDFFKKHSKETFFSKEWRNFICKECGKKSKTKHKRGGTYCSEQCGRKWYNRYYNNKTKGL